MPWSKEQLRAIETTGKNLLVSAAAGSGKTSVLVARIIRRILAGEFDVDRLLVVTFTKAAAAEMRERIETALHAELECRSASPRLERQLVLLSNASISTIHSFCQSVIRQNFHVIDLDPKFRLANEQELSIIRREIMEDLFERKYEEQDAAFLHFVEGYGSEKGDAALYEIVLRLFVYSQSQAFPELWLDSLPEPFALPEGKSLRDTKWYPAAVAEIQCILEFCSAECTRAIKLTDLLDFDIYLPTLQEDKEIVEHLRDLSRRGSWQELQTAFDGIVFPKLKSAPKGTDAGLKQKFTGPRDTVKKAIKELREKYFLVTEEELIGDLRAVQPEIAEICRLAREFASDFAAAKRRKTLVDFNDLEHFTLDILCDEDAAAGELKPGAAALALQQRYQEVMVDEYQDINGVQEAILSLLVREKKKNLFAVGDVKQSVYRFRLADPTLFLRKYADYRQRSLRGEAYERIDLTRNFRSRPEILSAINFIFAQVMTPDTMELLYDDVAALHAGPEYMQSDRETLAGPVELTIIAKKATETPGSYDADESSGQAAAADVQELKNFELEAQHIALRLQGLMQSQVQVFDKAEGGYRPIRWRDMVILLRAAAGKANILLDILRNHNIPVYAEVDAGYFEETEIRVILALLSILDNARQDIPLAAVLYSPVVGLSMCELAELRIAAPEEDLFGALMRANDPETSLPEELRAKTADFLRRLASWRSLAQQVSVPELLWQLYRDTGYYDYVGGMPGGLLRQANLRMLCDRAEAYEQTNFRGLFRFLRFVEKMQGMENDLSVARVLGESEDVVRIMSIHKSKGLEFPVVVLADCGKAFNLQDARGGFLVHSRLGLGPRRVEIDKSIVYPTFAHKAIAARIVQETKAEEMRLLYVAFTRAREKLIIVGSVTNVASAAEKWCRYISSPSLQVPEYASLAASSYLDWICMAVSRHADGEPLREAAETAGLCAERDYAASSHWQVDILTADDISSVAGETKETDALLEKVKKHEKLEPGGSQEQVEAVLNWQYDQRGMEDVPAKLSVTEIKRRFLLEDEIDTRPLIPPPQAFRRPDFIRGEKGLTGTEYGTILHSVMQHIDLAGDLSYNGIKAQVDGFVAKEILLPEQRDAVYVKSIQQFFTSELGLRMQRALHIWRELSFSRMLPARRFYRQAEDENEQIFSQGIIDVLFEEADGMVLLDYKTDRDTTPEKITARYHLQIELYREAVEQLLHQHIKECYLYMMHDGSLLKL